MPIIDIHTHIYPAKIAEKATQAVGTFYDCPMYGVDAREEARAAWIAQNGGESVAPDAVPQPGTVDQLVAVTAGCPITHHVVHSVATKPAQVESINNFILAQCAEHPGFIGFGCMHQDYENPVAELERIKAAGLHGVKIHPDIQAVDLNDPRLMVTYEACQRLGLPVMLHTGDYRHDFSHPRRLIEVMRTFPQLRIDAAHMGGWSMPDIAYDILKDEMTDNLFVDASSTFEFTGLRHAKELINLFGTDRVLFGSDFPMSNPVTVLRDFLSLGFSAAENDAILWHNAERYLGFEVK